MPRLPLLTLPRKATPLGRLTRGGRVWLAASLAPLLTGWLAAGLAVARESSPAQPPTADDALQYHISRWTTADGLPQNSVSDIAVLPDGELWLATFGGVARFDGHVFRVLDIASDGGLPDNRVVALVPDGQQGLWFLTHHGHLGRLVQGRAQTLVRPAAPTMETLSLSVDGRGQVSSQTVDGSVWRAAAGQGWQRLLSGNALTGALHGIAVTDAGELWTTVGERLRVLQRESGTDPSVPGGARQVFRRAGGGLWVGTGSGLAELRDGQVHGLDVRPALTSEITAVEQADAGTLWVASRGEVSRLVRQPGGWWRRATLPLGLPAGHFVRSLRLDGQGGLWIGTTGLGLYRAMPFPVRRVGAGIGLDAVTALAGDGEGGAFLVDWCRGLVHVAASGAATRVTLDARAPAGATAPCSMALAGGEPGHVWLRTEARLFDVSSRDHAVRRLDVTLPKEPGPVVRGADGTLWIISRNGLVQRLTPSGSEQRRWTLPAPLVSASAGPDGRLWVGGDGHVSVVGDAGVTRLGPAEHVPAAEVRDILVEPDGSAWIATYGGGLGRLQEGRMTRLTTAHGLPDNAISSVLGDDRARLWLSTNRGLAVVDRDQLAGVAAGTINRVSPVVFGTERGVDEATFGSPAGFRDAANRLWFGTISGAVSIDAGRFPFNATPPRARVTRVLADDRPLAAGEPVGIEAGTSRVRLEFSALPLTYAERVSFRYRVDGMDDDWVETGAQRTLDWSPPGPGRYRLLVVARNEDGVWSTAPATVVLDVRPRWWQTTAFRAAAGGLLLLGVVMAYRGRVRALERRHGERLRLVEQQRHAEARAAELRAQLDHVSRVALAGELTASLAHEVSQPLAAMVNNAEAGRQQFDYYTRHPEELKAVLDDIVSDGLRASNVVRGIRAFLRPRATEMSSLDLSATVREMLPLVDRELREHGVILDLALADDLPPVEGVGVQIGQVIVNLIRNACEALAGIEAERRIRITTTAREGFVHVSVRDSGPGLEPTLVRRAFEPFVTTKPEGLGMGLAICRGIAEAHGGHMAAVNVTPGLEVVLSLPIARPTPGGAS